MDSDASSLQQSAADSNGAVTTEHRKDVLSPGNVQEDSDASSQVEQVSSSSCEEDGAPPAGAPEEEGVSVDSSLSEDENSQIVHEAMSDSASPVRINSVPSTAAKEVADDSQEGANSTADDRQIVSLVESAGSPKLHESTADDEPVVSSVESDGSPKRHESAVDDEQVVSSVESDGSPKLHESTIDDEPVVSSVESDGSPKRHESTVGDEQVVSSVESAGSPKLYESTADDEHVVSSVESTVSPELHESSVGDEQVVSSVESAGSPKLHESTADDEQVVSSVESVGSLERHEFTADMDDEQGITESSVPSEVVATEENKSAPDLHYRLDDTAKSDADSAMSLCMPSGIHVDESGHNQDGVETDMIHSLDISGSVNEGTVAGQPDLAGQDGILSSDVNDSVVGDIDDVESLEISSPPGEERLPSPIDLAVAKEIASTTMETSSDTNDKDVPRNVTHASTEADEMSRAYKEAEIASSITVSQSDGVSADSSESTQPDNHTSSETADDSFEYVGSSVVEDSVRNEAVNKEHRPFVSIAHEGLLNADQASPVFSTPNWEGQLPWNSSVDTPEASAVPETLEESELSKKQLTRQDNVPCSISEVAEDNDVSELDVTLQVSAPDVGELDEGGALDENSGTPPVTQLEDSEALREKPEAFSPDGPLVPNPVSVPDVITYYESIFPKKPGKEDGGGATDVSSSVPTVQTSDAANVPDVTVQASLDLDKSVNVVSKHPPSSLFNRDDIPDEKATAVDSRPPVVKLQDQEPLPVYDHNPETYSSMVGASSLLEDLVALPEVACIVGSTPGSAGGGENIDCDASDAMPSDYVQAAPVPVFHPVRQELLAVQHAPSTPSKDADEPFDDGTASRESPASTKSPCDSPPAVTDSPCDSPLASTKSPCNSPPAESESGPGLAGGSGFVYDPADFEPEPKRGGALTDQPPSLADIAPAEDEKTDPNTPFLTDLHGEKPIGWRSAFMEICCCCWTP